MRDQRHRSHAPALILALALLVGGQGALRADDESTDAHPRAHASHTHPEAADQHEAQAHKKHLYFRPGCRRNPWARGKSAPCWE